MTKTLKQRFYPALGLAAVMAGLLFTAIPAQAVELVIVPQCAREARKDPPSLNCVMQTFANIGQLILGITGSFALLMFVYGGFTMLTSGGASEKVSKGKTILTNSVIGIVIILTSGLLIQYGLGQLKLAQPTIGSRCAPGNPPSADANGEGTYMQLASGKSECVASCSQLAVSGGACADTNGQVGKSCVFTKDCGEKFEGKGLCCTP
jgi:hypothetical protein